MLKKKNDLVVEAIYNIKKGGELWEKYNNKKIKYINDVDICLAISDLLVLKNDKEIASLKLEKYNDILSLLNEFKKENKIKERVPLSFQIV